MEEKEQRGESEPGIRMRPSLHMGVMTKGEEMIERRVREQKRVPNGGQGGVGSGGGGGALKRVGAPRFCGAANP